MQLDPCSAGRLESPEAPTCTAAPLPASTNSSKVLLGLSSGSRPLDDEAAAVAKARNRPQHKDFRGSCRSGATAGGRVLLLSKVILAGSGTALVRQGLVLRPALLHHSFASGNYDNQIRRRK